MIAEDYHYPVPYYKQEKKEWCWAATAKSVIAAMTKGVLDPKQCTLADIAFNRSDCCSQPTPQACLKSCSDIEGLLLQVAGIHCTRRNIPLAFDAIPDQGLVIYEIIFASQGHWHEGETHTGIISGKRTKDGTQQVYFLDPDEDFFHACGKPAEGWVDYAWVLNGYHPLCKGNWLQSWTDITL